jgi:hypothetical protein
MKKFTKIFVLAIVISTIFSLFIQNVSADIGRKPSMVFNLVYETIQPVYIVSGQQIECDNKDCVGERPLENLGPQRFSCQQDSCKSMAYGYGPYHKLVIVFSDKNRESNIFKANSFNAIFDVRVTDSGLIVKETTPFFLKENIPYFLFALIITLIIELIVALIFLSFTKISKKLLLYIVIANLISLPIVWFIFPLFNLNLLLSEIFAIVFEACFIYLFNKHIISFKKILILSILINIASFMVGQSISFMGLDFFIIHLTQLSF